MRQRPALRKPTTLLMSLLAILIFTMSAHANLVTNGSFEVTSVSSTTTFQFAGVNGWSNSGNSQLLVTPSWYTNGYIVLVPLVGLAGGFPQTSPDLGNFVLSDGDYFNTPITQTISGLSPGSSYELSFYQALAQDTELNVTNPGPVSGQWQVSLGPDVQYSSMMFANGATPTYSPWKQQTMNFTAQYATEVLSFFSVGSGEPPMVALDGIHLDSVPEPAAIWLLATGSALLCWKWSRRKTVMLAAAKNKK